MGKFRNVGGRSIHRRRQATEKHGRISRINFVQAGVFSSGVNTTNMAVKETNVAPIPDSTIVGSTSGNTRDSVSSDKHITDAKKSTENGFRLVVPNYSIDWSEESKSEEKRYTCSQCRATFTKRTHLKRHSRIHTGNKPYKCSDCTATFSDKNHLKRHGLIHSGVNPHHCIYCCRAFALARALKRHQRSHSSKDGYRCYYCDMTMASESDMSKHKEIHIKEGSANCRNKCN